MRRKQAACSALDWNVMLGLCERLKSDGLYRDYLLILLGCHFGLRISDLLRITWEDAQGEEAIMVTEGKTGKIRRIDMNARVREGITMGQQALMPSATNQPILSNRWGRSMSVSYANKRLKWIFDHYQIKTENPSSHTLRKTFGRRVYQLHGETEASLVFLSEVFGHSTTAITRRYLGITQREISMVYHQL